MGEDDWLTPRFEANRARLLAVAYRMLGSMSEAEDAVQEAWLRLNRSDTSEVDNLAGWLTTTVGRVCLDFLRSRASRREEPIDEIAESASNSDPEEQVLLADTVGAALLVVLDTLAPAERLAFVLHDMFAVPFEEIAPIVNRSPAAARQLASRARRRVRGTKPSTDAGRQRAIVEAFLTAARDGDFDGLLVLLDPDVVLRADATAARAGATDHLRGAAAVAATFSGRARAARPALVDGVPGAVWLTRGGLRAVFVFTVDSDRITAIEIVGDRVRLYEFDLDLS